MRPLAPGSGAGKIDAARASARAARRLGAALVSLLVLALPAQADAWTEEKCRRYDRAWRHVLSGAPVLGPGFIAAQERFLAGGCLEPGAVCPETPSERGVADLLALMAVAEGMAGSFLPFGCPETD